MCLYQTIIKNRKYTKNKKNGGVIPTITDTRLEYIPIGCGNCIICRKEKARDWQVRLMEDIKTHTNGKMITLTFSNESIKELTEHYIKKTNKKNGTIESIQIKNLYGYEKDNQIATKAVRLFNERYRKTHKRALRHWLVTELGHKGTENIHLHGIIWTNNRLDEIQEIWKYGFIWKGYKIRDKLINYVNNKTVNYTVKYISKIDQRNKEYKSIVLCSPGIGKNYINSYNARKHEELEETYKTTSGNNISLPDYYKRKLFTEIDRERLWLQKLDRPYKWVMKEKVSTINGDKEYNKLIQYYRRINTQLGYGGKPNNNRKEYEELRRETLINTRIKNASGGV